MSDSRKYWKSIYDSSVESEITGDASAETRDRSAVKRPGVARRDFLKIAGFSFAGALITGCERSPVEKAIPYLIKPEEITPGRAYHYASTCDGCGAGCGLLVKNRDGRPIKLEGNSEHPISKGGLCAVGQASILGLYDSHRLNAPLKDGQQSSWSEVDRSITSQLERIRNENGAVRILTDTNTSPTTNSLIKRFLGEFADSRHIVYDPLSNSAILDAHQITHDVRVLPRLNLENADVIVSFDADFLGTFISPVEYTQAYQKRRIPENQPPAISYHVQFESRMSLTGSNADKRVAVAPEELGPIMNHLALRLAKKAGVPFRPTDIGQCPIESSEVNDLADRLWHARGRSLVLCGCQDIQTQVLCNFVNYILDNYGSTLDLEKPSYQRMGNDRDLQELLDELRNGSVKALFVSGVNPVYDLPRGESLKAALKEVPLLISFSQRADETSLLAKYICPEHHNLESWNDSEAVDGVVSLSQPAIHPLGDTRSMSESLAAWMGSAKPAYDLIRDHWKAKIFPRQSGESSFQTFWDRAVHDGFAVINSKRGRVGQFNTNSVQLTPKSRQQSSADLLTLVLYPKVAILDGRHAYNPWLQELPDPISKITWDNYACLSPTAAKSLGLAEGDLVSLSSADGEGQLELPVYLQPGQHDGIVAVALGYGRKDSERFAEMDPLWFEGKPSVGEDGLVGKNVATMLTHEGGALHYSKIKVKISKTGREHPLAATQEHNSLDVPKHLTLSGTKRRPIVKETILPVYAKRELEKGDPHHESHEDLWPPDHKYDGHHWGMVIDLNACTGCSACVIACQVENNIPTVGKDEVRRKREMHWIRIDRYYSNNDGNVDVVHQPMLCQQCDNAPCETVCPVLATVHSKEGLNQQIYNRCVGTRYCANNCPYKVRRFNWFNYPHKNEMENLVLNPDVTVRSRGVMEKCTFCVQRIQEAKIEAKRTDRELSDGVIRTACQQSCPAQAIVFGDMNDPDSKVSQLISSSRHYHVLGEFNFKPSIGYLELVRHREQDGGEERHV